MAGKRTPGTIRTLHAAGKGIVIQITGDGESAKRALQMVQEELRRLEEQKRRTAESADLNRAFNLARSAVAVTGLTLSVQALGSAIRSVIGDSLTLGQAIEKASIRTGLQAESLSVLHYATAITGDDFEGLTGALSKMNNTIAKAADGSAKESALIRALGLDAKDLTQRSDGAEVAFHAFIQRLAATENPLERTRLAMGLLGRAGAEQIPVLMKVAGNWDAFRQKAQEAGVLLDTETAQKLADTNARLHDLEQRATGAGLAFTEGMVPGLNQMMSVISAGKGDRALLIEWGHDLVRVLAGGASAAYGLAAGFKALQFITDIDPDNSAADKASGERYSEKAAQMRDIALGKTPPTPNQPFLPGGPAGPRGPGFTGASLAKPGKSGNPIAEALAALQQEQAKASADLQKATDQAELAEWETQHKLLLVSDQQFYKKKFDLENDELDAEEQALGKRRKTLENLQKKQQGDKLLKRDKNGNSAEELKTARELVQLQEQQDALTAKRQENESRYNGEVGAANQAAELAGLRAAAALERERNSGITAQIALIQREHELEAQKATLAGGSDADAQAIRDTGALAVQKLQLQQVEEAISRTNDDHSRELGRISDEEQKGVLSKRAAANETRQANGEAIQGLQQLAAQYRELATAIGDPALLQKTKDLDEQLATLGRTDRRGTFGKEVQDGLEGITTSIVDSAARGKQSFGDMARSILDDLDKLALKLAEEKFLLPLFQGGFGALSGGKGATPGAQGGGFGGAFGLPQLSIPDFGGGGGPSIYKPPPSSGGGFGSAATGIAAKIAESAATSAIRSPKVTSNLINQSSQPLSSGPPQVTYDESAKEFVISTIVQNHSEGGILSQLQSA